jgi:hypothetical protein
MRIGAEVKAFFSLSAVRLTRISGRIGGIQDKDGSEEE